uniref:LRRCT domain-containing protein n=1 Tax=Branchiostoma floridae TaxID=7739 RepID=C3ZKN0_BRAFL|eukprot:XP_002590868.1 hypothetical protein BRAFLDRAFT_101126 [Branchiostoma floridae]
MAHSRLLSLVIFLAWSGLGCTASYPNLKCCCPTYYSMHNGNITRLTCYDEVCSFRSIPKPLPTSLERFMVSHQNIPKIVTGDFTRLESLTALIIQGSQVMTIQPGSFQTLTNLLELSLVGNKISRLEAETFRGLAKLEDLDLDNNRLHYIDGAAFVGLTVLRKLTLNKNCLSSIPRGTDQTTQPLKLIMTYNPIMSIIEIGELKHILSLILAQNGILCDCRLREMKRWMTMNNHLQWHITCAHPVTRLPKRLRWIRRDDLRCTSNVTKGSAGTEHEFEPWRRCHSTSQIPAPNHIMERSTYSCPVRYEHSNDPGASTMLPVAGFPGELLKNATHETSTGTTTYTSQSQTTVGDTTTQVESKEVATGPGFGLSAIHLTLVGLASFLGCSVIAGVIAFCVRKCKAVRQQDNADGQRDAANRHYENDDQFSDTDSARGVTYENDDQFSDTGGARVHYENDDQFSDTDGANRNQYENDDQFSDTDGANRNQYENDDQFSDTDGANTNQYDYDDQFSDDDSSHRTIPHKLVSKKTRKTFSLAKAEHARRRRIQKRLAKRRATEDRRKAKSTVLTVLADVHAQAQANGHYDNDKDCVGLNSREATKSLDNAVSDGGHYANERPVADSVTKASESTKRHDDDSDSDHDYMTLPNLSPGEGTGVEEGGKKSQSKPAEDRNSASTSACANDLSDNDYITFPGEENADGKTGRDLSTSEDSSDHTYVTLPGEENAEEQQSETGQKNGQAPDIALDSSDAEDCSDHTYITFPATENAEEQQRERGKKSTEAADITTDSSDAEDCSDHTYITFPATENAEEQQRERGKKSAEAGDIATDSSGAEDYSDHTYVTFPGTDDAEEHTQETKRQNGQVSDCVVSIADDISDHFYVTLPETENVEKRKEETERQNGQVSDSVVSIVDDISDHFYVTLPETENAEERKEETEPQNGHVSDLDSVSSNTDISDHIYVTFPETEIETEY